MFGGAAFAAPGTHGWNIGFPALLVGAVRLGSELDESVQGHVHPRALRLILFHEIGIDAPQHSLMRDNENVFAAFQFHDDGLEADDHVSVRLSATVTVVVLVFIASRKVFRIPVLNLLICQTITHSRVKLIEGLPL